jgi:hypothetical protein
LNYDEAVGEGKETNRRGRQILLETGGKGRDLAKLVSTVMWKVENVPNELGGLVKEISREI